MASGASISRRAIAHVKAGDDFFAYANGSWLAKTEIPADQPSTSTGYELYNLTQNQLRALIEASASNPTTPTAAQIGGLYKSFMDEAAVEGLDAKPLASDLAAIEAVRSKDEFVALMGKTATNVGISLFGAEVDSDAKKPVSTPLSLSGRPWNAGPRLLLDGSVQGQEGSLRGVHCPHVCPASRIRPPEAKAKSVLAFETRGCQGELARGGTARPRQDLQPDDRRRSCKRTRRQSTGAPIWPAPASNELANLVVAENTAFPKIARLFADTPLETLKAWEAFHVVAGASPYLSKRFVDSRLRLPRTRRCPEQPEQRPRWKRGVSLVDGRLGEAVGKVYVAKLLPAGLQGEDGDARRQPEDRDGGAHRASWAG